MGVERGAFRQMKTITESFSEMCSSFDYESMSATARAKTKDLIIDTVGVMLAATTDANTGFRMLCDELEDQSSPGHSLIVGSKLRGTPAAAGQINGYLGYALDSDSVYRPAIMHGGAAIVPGVLATLRPGVISGKKLLAAVALGVEVASRANMAVGPESLYSRGYHPTAFGAAFGTAAASGMLLGLAPEGMERALGLAALQAGGLLAWASDTTEQSRPMSVGFGVRNGVTAAALAKRGFGGPRAILDSDAKYNIYRTWSEGGKPEKISHLTEPLQLCDAVQNLVYKRHGCCAFIHPAIDILLDIMNAEGLRDCDSVEKIVMRFPRAGVDMIDNNPLRSHSAQYILTLAAAVGHVDFDDVLADRLDSLGISERARHVSLVGDARLDAEFPATRATILEVSITGKPTIERKLVYPLGAPENPLSHEQLVSKFSRMAAKRLGKASAATLLEWLEDVEEIPDAFSIGDLVAV